MFCRQVDVRDPCCVCRVNTHYETEHQLNIWNIGDFSAPSHLPFHPSAPSPQRDPPTPPTILGWFFIVSARLDWLWLLAPDFSPPAGLLIPIIHPILAFLWSYFIFDAGFHLLRFIASKKATPHDLPWLPTIHAEWSTRSRATLIRGMYFVHLPHFSFLSRAMKTIGENPCVY